MPKQKFPQNCYSCPIVAKVDDAKMTCTEKHWMFSVELAKSQALCDERANAEMPFYANY